MQDPFTLIVVLDQQGSAAGSLYLDDGHSYAYEKGSFSKSAISFQKGVLSNKVPFLKFGLCLEGLEKSTSLLPGDLPKTTCEHVVLSGVLGTSQVQREVYDSCTTR